MQPRRYSRAIAGLLAGALSLPSVTAWAGPADDLRDLVDARGSSGEAELERRGYTHIDTSKYSNTAYSHWWSNAKNSCIRVTTRDGRYQALVDTDPSDCGRTQKESGMSDGAKVAIGAAALLGIAALAHKSHHRDDRNYNEEQTADFERGYRDGLYNNSFHNYNESREYNDGYSKGVDERRQQSSYRWGNGSANYGSDWVACGNEGSFCSFRGPGVVRFGTDGRFVTRRGFDGMHCTTDAFGDDPAYGKRKQCFVRQDGR
jgi:hypothetical protein